MDDLELMTLLRRHIERWAHDPETFERSLRGVVRAIEARYCVRLSGLAIVPETEPHADTPAEVA